MGFAIHFLNGWLFSLLYALVFSSFGWSALVGGGRARPRSTALFVLVVLMPLLPNVHPRMATEDYGPSPTRRSSPPGSSRLNYGRRTPLVTLLAHVVYGAILGACHGHLYTDLEPSRPGGGRNQGERPTPRPRRPALIG